MIIHLDADAFFASVEQAADQRLRGRPVAVGGERRGVVASASYEARQWGIKAAMPTMQAKKLCPGLIVVPGDFEKYELFSRLIFAYAHDFTPLVEQTSIDEGYFDLGPNRKAEPRVVAERIREAVRQSLKVGISEGVASNKLVAQVASKLRKPAALVEVGLGEERGFLAPLPNRWLPGVGPKLAATLDAAGLREIGQIAAVPAEQLMLFAGEAAPQLRRFALGEDERPVVAERAEAKSYSKQETFEQDVTDAEWVTATLRAMGDRLMGKVRAEGKSVRTVSLKIRYNDFQDCLRSESFAEPTDLETDLYAPLARLLKACWTRRVSLRCVSVRLSRIYNAPPQELPLDEESERRISRSKVSGVIDALRAQGTPLMRGHDLWLKRVEERPREDVPRAVAKARAEQLGHERQLSFQLNLPKRGQACVEDYVPLNVRTAFSFMDSLLLPERAVAEAARRGLRTVGVCDPNLHAAVPFVQEAEKRGLRAVVGAELRVGGRSVLCYPEDRQAYARLCRLLSLEKVGEAQFRELGEGLVTMDLPEAGRAIRYGRPGDRAHYDILQSVRTLTRLHERHPEKRTGAFHWPGREEIAAMDPAEVRRTREIAERCQFSFEFKRLHFPAYVPARGGTAREFLRHLVMDGFGRHYEAKARGAGAGAVTAGLSQEAFVAQVRGQLEEELAIIAEVGYEEYFLVVWDILQECRRRDIPWITRGSAGDSLVCRCLDISDFCPIRFELYFRRFLNRDRMALNKLPDIDLDFPHDRKDDVIDLVFEKFGHEHAAIVGGFNTFQARSAVAEILKVLGVAEGQVRRFTDRFPWGRIADLPALMEQSRECTELPVDEEPYRTALQLAVFLDGFPRYAKMHPCGMVLSRVPIRELTPTFVSGKGYPTTHFDMDAVEAVGLVKMDILAQGGLAVLRDTEAAVAATVSRARGERRGARGGSAGVGVGGALKGDEVIGGELQGSEEGKEEAGFGEPWEDPVIWRMIAGGEARGVHHIESPAMISLSRMCQASNIDQLVAIVSVIRPGAANNLKKVTFARRCQGLEPVEYAHPSLAGVLKSTFGVVAYEEHILQISEEFAGLPPGRADVLRRALVKEKQETIREIQGEFAACARAKGRTEEEIVVVWGLVAGFQGYAFCRAHSTAYALEAYQAAWYKSRYPAEFLAGVLTHGKGFYTRLVYTLEARRLGIGFLRPDINCPQAGYSVERKAGKACIRVPVTAVKDLTAATLANWAKGLPYESLDDFIRRVPADFLEIQNLIRVGAFDGFGRKRAAQFWEASAMVMESGLGAGLGLELVTLPSSDRLSDTTRAERLESEWELLGYTVEDHPLARYDKVDWDAYEKIDTLGTRLDQEVNVCGLVVNERLHNQEDGRIMKFVLLADRSGLIECELFADVYEKWGPVVARNPVVALIGVVTPFDNRLGWTLCVKKAEAPRGRGQGENQA